MNKERVELHCHTNMTEMEGVSSAEELITKASEMGMSALAITDCYGVWAFPDVYTAARKINQDGKPFKVIYGCEMVVADDFAPVVTNANEQNLDGGFTVVHIEATNYYPSVGEIIGIGAVKIRNGSIIDTYWSYIKPQNPITSKIYMDFTGITNDMLENEPDIEKVFNDFVDFCGDDVLVSHNAEYHMEYLSNTSKELNISFNPAYIDTYKLSWILYPHLDNCCLDLVAKELDISVKDSSRIMNDAKCLADVFIEFRKRLIELDIKNINDIDEKLKYSVQSNNHMSKYRSLILVKNQKGLENLYKIITFTDTEKNTISKSMLNKYREGLIIGCCVGWGDMCVGELSNAIFSGKKDKELFEIAEFYDFLEIETDENNSFLFGDRDDINKYPDLLNDLNKTIIDIGEKTGKPVVASSNVYYADASLESYYRIVSESYGEYRNDRNLRHYLVSTEELIKRFECYGKETAQKIVIENPNKIADMVEAVIPISEEKYYPQLLDADDYIRNMSFSEAYHIYGDVLPFVVQERLEKELKGIIENGYSSIFLIYAKLAEECWTLGYLNGTRGSVGGSLVAYLLGITDTNPLPPHYLCHNCNYTDFKIIYDTNYKAGYIGADLPDRICPICGKKMNKGGYDIPVEVFMGIKYDKEPDIELNVAKELQKHLQRYVRKIDGISEVVRPGTIKTVPYKLACQLIEDYYDYYEHDDIEEDDQKNHSEIKVDRLADVRLETGVHPTAVFPIPDGVDINKVTPLSSVDCDEINDDLFKTHFEYWRLYNNLLKVRVGTNIGFTMLKRLEECTGVNPETIPLYDDKMISLLYSPDALGVTEKQINCSVGTLGTGGFENHFFIYGIVTEAKPKNLSEIIKVLGFQHGTGTWIDNAYDLIEDGNTDISELIAFRDDIFKYLVNIGIDHETAYDIMEFVRKGKSFRYGLKEEWITLMKKHGIPDWYINSCKKIKYLFPKAHAAVYALMCWRILYYKLYYPEAFYTVWLECYAKHVDVEFVKAGQEYAEKKFDYILDKLKEADENISDKEDIEYSAMEELCDEIPVVLEMYARGVNVESVVSLVNVKSQKMFSDL